jgi:hypothetical protein
MKIAWGSGVIAPTLLNPAVDGGEWPGSRHDRFTPGEIAPGIHWTGAYHGGREVWTISARSNAGIVASNPTQNMDVCVCVYSVCR